MLQGTSHWLVPKDLVIQRMHDEKLVSDKQRHHAHVGWHELGLPLDSICDYFLQTMPGARIASAALGKSMRVSITEDSAEPAVLLPLPNVRQAA